MRQIRIGTYDRTMDLSVDDIPVSEQDSHKEQEEEMDAKKCEHYWSYPHNIIEGRKKTEVAVVRYCSKCGARQVAFASDWKKATGDYALDEHYE